MDTQTLVKIIQLMLAPAIMINACGLLLLSVSNKNTSISNRLRALNEEKRRFMAKIEKGIELDYLEISRFQSVGKQIKVSLNRLWFIRNVILSYVSAVFLFIFTSILIGLEVFFGSNITKYIYIGTFALGMISVGMGLIFALSDTLKGYKILQVEVKADD